MIRDNRAMAAVKLFAILRNLEDLCELDSQARQIIQGANICLRFKVPDIESMDLVFSQGTCKAVRSSDFKPRMNLKFSSVDHFNKMIDGKANPIPLSAFSKLGFLTKQFTQLADLLTTYLRPDPKRLQEDLEFSRKSTILTAYTAFFALAQIANYDQLGRVNAGRIQAGTIFISIQDGPSISLDIREGQIQTSKGKPDKYNALMSFDSIETAQGILSGKLDTYAAIGSGRMAMSGNIPMIDNLNKILELVALYLQ